MKPRPPPFQLDHSYRGHQYSVIAAERAFGWSWAALINNIHPLESVSSIIATAELAMAEGKAAVESFIDAPGFKAA